MYLYFAITIFTTGVISTAAFRFLADCEAERPEAVGTPAASGLSNPIASIPSGLVAKVRRDDELHAAGYVLSAQYPRSPSKPYPLAQFSLFNLLS